VDALLGALIGALAAIAGAALSSWSGMRAQHEAANGALRLRLFEKQLEAHAAVARQLLVLRVEVTRVLATSRVNPAGRREAAKVLNHHALETQIALDEHNFYLDRTAGEAMLGFLVLTQRVRDGDDVTPDELGVAYGQVLDVLQRVMAMPELANETHRRTRPRQALTWPWRRRTPGDHSRRPR
jgi:hypothetical protein